MLTARILDLWPLSVRGSRIFGLFLYEQRKLHLKLFQDGGGGGGGETLERNRESHLAEGITPLLPKGAQAYNTSKEARARARARLMHRRRCFLSAL